MKKAILFVLVIVLTMCLMAGCRRGNNAESVVDDVSNAASEMMPDGNSGAATDGDGIIGEDNGSGTGNGNVDNGTGNGGVDNGTGNGGVDNSTGNGGVNNGTGNSTRSGGFLPIHN